MKKLLLFLLAGIVASTVFLSCKDKFNEESFLRLQAKLKRSADSAKAAQAAAVAAATVTAANTAAAATVTAQAAALNAAGLLASLTVSVLEDKTPLAGVVVVLANTGGTTPTATATTDANGNAVFSNIVIAGVTVNLSKAGYATADVSMDLGSLANNRNYQQVTSPGPGNTTYTQIIPIKQAVVATVPMFAIAGATSVATVKGSVQIETDLTNTTFEIPQGLTLVAQIASATGDPSSIIRISGNGGAATIGAYILASAGLGTAAVNATTGAFSMTVPASSAGLTLDIIAPTITANQTLWINSVGTGAVAATATRVKRTDIPATFELVPFVAQGTFPTVIGTSATAAFTAPPASGVGFDFTYAPVSRTLDNNSGNSIVDAAATLYTNTWYQLGSRGSAYATPPTITVSASATPGTTLATAGPQMSFMATALTTTGGTGYGATVSIALNYVTAAGNVNAANFNVNTVGGVIPATITLPTGTAGFDSPYTTSPAAGQAVTGFNFTCAAANTTPAVFTGTFTSDVNGVIIAAGNTKYATAPTFTFSAGTASFSILEYKTQWAATPSTTPATTPYKVRPTTIALNYAATTYTVAQGPISTVDIIAANGVTTVNNAAWIGTALTSDGTNIVTIIPNQKYWTDEVSSVAPTIAITNVARLAPTGTVTLSANGTTTGQILSIAITAVGTGYDVAPVISVTQSTTPANGTGFVAPVITGTTDAVTRVFSHSVTTLTVATANQGTGYFSNLNRQVISAQTGPANVVAKPGQTYIRNLFYGQGNRYDNVYN